MYRRMRENLSYKALLALSVIPFVLLSACSNTTPQVVPERIGTAKDHGLSTLAATLSDLSSVTATDLANVLAGSGVAVSNVTYTGDNQAAGTFSFTDQDDVIGFSQGIILSSGKIVDVVGPNTSNGTTTVFETPGDAELTALSGVITHDAAVLEFDFVPDDNKVYFQYVFGSEEYNEWVGNVFNDVFGFFVNGVNCAVVGDPPVPVTINTINNNSNSSLYIDNTAGVYYTEMDGFSAVLTCETTVNPGVTNRMKLAIADGRDQVFDSWVFIKQGSLTTTPPGTDPEQGDEGCSPDFWRNWTGEGRGNQTNAWELTGYETSHAFKDIFNITSDISIRTGGRSSTSDPTLLEAVSANGGGVNALARQAVAALLNASHPNVDYFYSVSDVLDMVKEAIDGAGDVEGTKDALEAQNEMGCSLGN